MVKANLRRLGSSLGGLFELPTGEQALELLPYEALCARQVASPGQRQRQIQVVELRAHKRHDGGLVHCGQQHLAPPA